jgi:hypothetical protein
MLYKNLPDNELKHVMRVRWFLDYLAAFETLILNRNFADFKAIFKARRARAFKNWPERCKFSILWKYYFNGKKIFSDLFCDNKDE